MMEAETPPTRRRHPHKVLSARQVESAKATGKTRRYADGNGLYLVLSASGSKSWVLRTLVHGHRTDIGLGSASLVSLKDARDEAQRLRRVARDGGDPLAVRRLERQKVPTFKLAAEQVHHTAAAAFRNDKHRKQWLASLKDAFDAFGAKPVNTVTSADIVDLLTPRWLSRPETSRRVLQRLRAVFDWAIAKNYAAQNPTTGVKKAFPPQAKSRRHHAALPYAEIKDFLAGLEKVDASAVVKLALQLTILTATRTTEVLCATWEEFDVVAKVWTIPGSRMKAGIEHRVPLTEPSLLVLQQAKARSPESPYAFPGRDARAPLSNMALLMVLRRMNRADITVHGFRSTFRVWAEEQTGFPRAVAEAALAHQIRDKTEAAYLRTDLFAKRRELMDAWANHCEATGLPTHQRE